MTEELTAKINRVCDPARDGWTSPEQGLQMAEAIIALRPIRSVEIGVYAGKGLITMALAHKSINHGKVIGIDPWMPSASADGMPDEHRDWWSKLDHEAIYQKCLANIKRYQVGDFCELVRSKSGDVTPPEQIGVLRIDGNHGPESLRDVRRYAVNVMAGGMLYLDDAHWPNGPLENGADEELLDMGFNQVGIIDGGLIFKRTKA